MARGENIYLRKDGRFEARYTKGRDDAGKLIYGFCYGRTYGEAQEKARYARHALAGEIGQPDPEDHTFGYYCDSWLLANSARLKPSSCARYLTDIENHIKPFFGMVPPYRIVSEHVDLFTQHLLQEKALSPKTVRDILALFHSIFVYAGRRGGRKLPDLEIIYPKQIRKTVRILDEKEERMLMLFLVNGMDLCKFGIYLAMRTGMRIGEICALRWKDISFEMRTISVRYTAQRIRKPDAHTGPKTEIIVGTPKSDSSFRTIPLMPDLEKICRRFCSDMPDAFVLTGTGRCMEPRKLQRRLKQYTAECRMEQVHFHTLRHTFATRCVEAGFDIKTLSEILGHSSVSITLSRYVHPNMDMKRENMNRLKTVI